MVEACWLIGKRIIEEQGGLEKSEYGSNLINTLSSKLTEEFGKGFNSTNFKYMRQFYLAFPNRHSLRDQLTWTHYRLLMRIENEDARSWYMEECIKSAWSSRQLD